MASSDTVTGNCLCGSVGFTLTLPSKWCAHCHCSMCRSAHGAGYVTWVGFEESQLTMTAGDDVLKWYESSTGAQRGFCSTCGSSMFFRSQRWSGEIHVTRANLNGEIDRQPQAHAFHNSHVNWMPLDDALQIFNG